jgi:hypothetical protein
VPSSEFSDWPAQQNQREKMLAIKILNYNLENYYTESGACARILPRHPPPFVAAPIHQNIRFNRTFAAFYIAVPLDRTFAAFYMAFCRGAGGG